MDDRTYNRMFQETPRQRRIRHNWPVLCGQMTRQERLDHVHGLEQLAAVSEEPRRPELLAAAEAFRRIYP